MWQNEEAEFLTESTESTKIIFLKEIFFCDFRKKINYLKKLCASKS